MFDRDVPFEEKPITSATPRPRPATTGSFDCFGSSPS